MATHEDYMALAVEEARKAISEPGRASPKVGAVAVLSDGVVISGYRGELGVGDHAEFTVLERKAGGATLANAIIYTTLEPCTKRNLPKIPCVDRLIERKVSRVFIGMVDPNPLVSGRGMSRLRDANIAVDMFPDPFAKQIEELNREFVRAQKGHISMPEEEPGHQVLLRARTLDELYRGTNRTYWNQNYHRDASSIFTHLVEVIGGLSALASSKKKSGVNPETHIAKAFGWWFALCGKLGIKSVEQMVWDKFPGVCAYCHTVPHDPDSCLFLKAASAGPAWEQLEAIGNRSSRPLRIKDWQVMFSKVYPAQQTEEFGPSFARLAEELGELAEAIRVFRSEPGYVLSEASDVFAWLMHIQNLSDTKNNVRPVDRGSALESALARLYPGGCAECRNLLCTCPPILSSTIGRIAHEVPAHRGSFGKEGRFLSADAASRYFQGD